MQRLLLLISLGASACGSDSVSSADDARKAYIGLDASIDKSITLGFDGFNMAQSANISPQMVNGTISGTLTVTGQVDQGSSANKDMRLVVALASYSDDGQITYATDATAMPTLTMQLRNIPNGTVDGTLVGSVAMVGMEHGNLMLNLTFSGQIEAGPNNTVIRKPGTTHITGTATSSAGTYDVDVTR